MASTCVGYFEDYYCGETQNIKGKYVINFYSVVIDTDIAFRLLLNEINESYDTSLHHIKIASIPYVNGDDYTLMYSSDGSTDFSI